MGIDRVTIEITCSEILVRGDYRTLYNFLVNWQTFANLVYNGIYVVGKEGSEVDEEYFAAYESLPTGIDGVFMFNN